MELKDFKGKMILDAVDFSNEKIKDEYSDEYEDSQVCRFRLNGVVYSAVEDPSDGYRSMMRELVVNENDQMTNTFPPTEVLCRHRTKNDWQEDDILELVDTTTSEIVLEVGTANHDDYYPYYVANFYPEAMAINKDKL